MPRAGRDLASVYAAINAEESDALLPWFRGLERALFSLEETPARCPVTPKNVRLRHLLYGNKPHINRVIFETRRAKRMKPPAGDDGCTDDGRPNYRFPPGGIPRYRQSPTVTLSIN